MAWDANKQRRADIQGGLVQLAWRDAALNARASLIRSADPPDGAYAQEQLRLFFDELEKVKRQAAVVDDLINP